MVSGNEWWDTPPEPGSTPGSFSPQSDSPQSSPLPTSPQGWVGGYHLLTRIGSGGTGTVWEAADEGGNKVALKLLHPSIADTEEARKRLLRETRLVNQIRSHGISRVLDVEADAFTPFVVTELIEGPTLDEATKGNPLDQQQTLALAHNLADILEEVHAAGVTHRDLKPSNIMLGPDGPVLIDFGIAQSVDDSRITQTGSVTGTPGYVAAEILRESGAPSIGQWQDSDWFAWTAVLLSALTGRPPFGRGTTHAILHRLFRGEPDTEGLPPHLSRAFQLALSPEPELRPSPDSLLAALELDEPLVDATAVMTRVPVMPQGPVAVSDQTVTGEYWTSNPVESVQGVPWTEGLPFVPEAYVYRHPYPEDAWILSALLLVMLGSLPAHLGPAGALIGVGVLLVFQVLGRTEVHVATRRNRFGGPRRSDGAIATLAAPWNVLIAFVVLLPGLVAGATAFILLLVLANLVGALVAGNPPDFASLWDWLVGQGDQAPGYWEFVVAAAGALLTVWVMPTSRWARIGLGRLFSLIAPTPGLRWVWGSLFVTAFVFLAAL